MLWWLPSYGDALKITARVSDIATIFKGEFHLYHHLPSGHKAIRADHFVCYNPFIFI